ncbi:hypothetical protein AHAS_Ahas16G0266300 [Arachis hypogaea]
MSVVQGQHAGGVVHATRGGREDDMAAYGWTKRESRRGHDDGTANLVVYRDGEIIRNTHEGVRFVCQNPFSFVVPCTMTLMEL